MRRFLTVTLMLASMETANASPWPLEASVAYVEELQLACIKLYPERSSQFQARSVLLFSGAPEVASKIKARADFDTLKKWARGEIASLGKDDLVGQCDSFLTNSNLAIRQEYHEIKQPVPAE